MITKTTPPIIETMDLYKSFGNKKVLRGINLSIEKGESLAIIGTSGSGKSVLIKNIIGLHDPDSGVVRIKGKNVLSLNDKQRGEFNRKFGVLFQGAALFDSLPIWENITFGLIQLDGLDRKIAYEKAKESMAQVGLSPEIAKLYPAELSGGMKKRVGLARAIATKPEVMFFDEPTTGLDPIMACIIDNLIIKNVRELGATALTITHDMSSARRIADKIAMIHEGKIIWNGPVNEINNSGNSVVEQFINGFPSGPIETSVVG
jgi:phospholipid/cholesterol/gamma-HCH transport system ATP-binding protein